jgi:hypothetical protein
MELTNYIVAFTLKENDETVPVDQDNHPGNGSGCVIA